MAIVLVVADVIHLRLGTYCNGQLGLNDLFYSLEVITGGDTLLEDLPDAFFDFAKDHYKPLFHPNAQFVGTSCRIVFPGFRRTNSVLSDKDPVDGSAGDGALPTQDTGMWNFKTALPGRAAFGRNYLPFPSVDGATSQGRPSEAYITAMANWASFMSPNIHVPVKTHALDFRHGVFGKATNFNQVIASKISGRFATQRRRGDYGKQNPNPWA